MPCLPPMFSTLALPLFVGFALQTDGVAQDHQADPAQRASPGKLAKFSLRQGGRRRLRSRGGGQIAESIRLGLEWLEKHQDPEGRWSAARFTRHCSDKDFCEGSGKKAHNIGVTALALLCYMGDGSSMKDGPYKKVVRKGISWLRKQINKDGLVGRASKNKYVYSHAIASLALVEAYGLSQYRILRRDALRAVNYIHAAKNPDKVWRYQPKDGTNDSSVTTWMAITLQSARDFGLPIAKKDLEDVLAWFDEVTDPASGRVGYKRKGEASFREKRSVLRFPPSKTEALTAMGLFSRILLGQTPKTNPVLNLSAQRLLEKPPVWNEADGSIDMYYWYFGTYAMFQMGKKYWKGWRKGLESALLKHQRKDGHSKGSWDPVGVWGEEGGRIYSTALSVLCLEVYYRYRALLR